MKVQLNPPPPRLALRLIRSNPARRYCTKRRTVRVFPQPGLSTALYVATFCQLNNLKG